MQKIGAFDQPVAVAQSRCGDVDGIDGPETNGQQESVYADALAIHIVVGAVVRDDYEMSTRETLQLGANCWHVEIAARPARLYSHMRKHSGDSQQDHRQANQRNDSHQRLAEAIAVEPPQSQAAHALHEDEINDAGCRCNIIWECPKFD